MLRRWLLRMPVLVSTCRGLSSEIMRATVKVPHVVNGHGFSVRNMLGTILNYQSDLYVHSYGRLASLILIVARRIPLIHTGRCIPIFSECVAEGFPFLSWGPGVQEGTRGRCVVFAKRPQASAKRSQASASLRGASDLCRTCVGLAGDENRREMQNCRHFLRFALQKC